MSIRKLYIKPRVTKIDLDLSITLIMKSKVKPPPPRGGGSNQPATPFESPFGDKPFS
jgi:hypothetical protein